MFGNPPQTKLGIPILALSKNTAFDKNGESTKIDNSSNWGAPIFCSIKTNSKSNKGRYGDGKFTIAKYEIFIENTLDVDMIERVMLQRDGKPLGAFEVHDIQKLSSVERIKIIV